MFGTRFECALCGETKKEVVVRWISDYKVCDECAEESIKPRFLDALKHEHHYPPMWGNVEIGMWTVYDLLDDAFQVAWRKKLLEYAVPVADRVYCEHRDRKSGDFCGEYLGTRGEGHVCCSRCAHYTCKRCGSSHVNSKAAHFCKAPSKDDPLANLRKGNDYQLCPGCDAVVFQAEGCNHMTCVAPCNASFCFVCGEKVAADRSGHWQKGGCPRFGVPGRTLIWDDPGEHSEVDSEEDGMNNEDREAILADENRVQHLIQVFDHAAEAERFESNRARYSMFPFALRSDARARFFGYVALNLTIVLRIMRTNFHLDEVAPLLEEFRTRHQRIRNQYQLCSAEAPPLMGAVTQLSDLSDEFDSYFIYALETLGDLTHISLAIANERRERPERQMVGLRMV